MNIGRKSACIFVLVILQTQSHAQQFFYECENIPALSGWDILGIFCGPDQFTENGQLFQHVQTCETQPEFGQSADYTRDIGDLSGEDAWFIEWRLETDGISEEIPFVAPSVLVFFDGNGFIYHFTIADDQFRLVANDFSSLHTVSLGEPHTFRVELFGENLGEFYAIYVDGEVIFSGALAPLWNPPWEPGVNIGVKSKLVPSTTVWDYIRWGPISPEGSGDFNGDGEVDSQDTPYFEECLASASGNWIGCAWADFNGDGDVDCGDGLQFQLAWTGAGDPPSFEECAANFCEQDLNDDNAVDAADLATLLGGWGPNPGHAADFNGDNTVDAADLAPLLGSWGPCKL